ncbi:MAG: hypothetical protein ABIJ40_00720 [Bacteroidota bacterium]|uniref:Uncharacterized protein n=1 Tax=viral metagenome TaxID=1070528 RepID=A0A6M3KJU4_9ZZZZ
MKTQLSLHHAIRVKIRDLKLRITSFTYYPAEEGSFFKPPWPAEIEIHEAYAYSESTNEWKQIDEQILYRLMRQDEVYNACFDEIEKRRREILDDEMY